MKTASVTDAKNNLSALIDGLRGGPVMILDRGRPVARLELPRRSGELGGNIEQLIRSGLVTPARSRLAKDFWTRPLPRLGAGISASQALLDERREGR